MNYEQLKKDFNSIRRTQDDTVCDIIDEAENYIDHLEKTLDEQAPFLDKYNQFLAYFDQLEASQDPLTKQDMLDQIDKILGVK